MFEVDIFAISTTPFRKASIPRSARYSIFFNDSPQDRRINCDVSSPITSHYGVIQRVYIIEEETWTEAVAATGTWASSPVRCS
jgi:hypothetical protein